MANEGDKDMTTRKTYTTKIHISNIKLMLERKRPYELCPAGEDFCIMGDGGIHIQARWENDPCLVCMDFSEVNPEDGKIYCPCLALGRKKTIKRAREALRVLEGTKA